MNRPNRAYLVGLIPALLIGLTAGPLLAQSRDSAPADQSPEQASSSKRNYPIALLSTSVGVDAGIMGEYVYVEDSPGDVATISYLEWELLPLATTGVSLDLRPFHFLSVGGEARFPLTRRTGSMENSDYLNSLDRSERTHFSEHTAVVDSFRDFRIDLSGILDLRELGDLPAAVGLGLRYRDRFVKMHALNGFYDYPDSSGDVTGVPITYEQHQRALLGRISAELSPLPTFGLSASVAFSPFTRVDALDHHHRRLLDFIDTLEQGMLWEVDASGEVGLGDRSALVVKASWVHLPEQGATTQTRSYTSDPLSGVLFAADPGGAGVSYNTWGLSVSFRRRLF